MTKNKYKRTWDVFMREISSPEDYQYRCVIETVETDYAASARIDGFSRVISIQGQADLLALNSMLKPTNSFGCSYADFKIVQQLISQNQLT